MLALRKVAVGIKVLPESEDVTPYQLPMAVELSQRLKNRHTIQAFSQYLLGFEPIQGATPFYDTDMMDLPLIELTEMPRAAHALFPLLPPVGMSAPSLGGCWWRGEQLSMQFGVRFCCRSLHFAHWHAMPKVSASG